MLEVLATKENKTTARYMALFEVDTSKTPEDPRAKKAQWLSLAEPVAKLLKEGVITEWCSFAGGLRGYMLFEGSVIDPHTLFAAWVPFVKFKTGESVTIDEVVKATKALPE